MKHNRDPLLELVCGFFVAVAAVILIAYNTEIDNKDIEKPSWHAKK